MLSAAANGVGAWVATVFAYWTGHYFVFGSAFALTLGLILLVPLVLIAMARIEEIAAIAFGRQPAPADRQDRRHWCRRRSAKRHLPQGLDPCPGLFRTAGDAQADARCGGAARLSEFRMRRDHQQHARSGILAADPGSLPRARRALQVHQRREGRGLQGRRPAHRHGAHRRRCRDHRHHRRRLCRAAGLAEGSGAGVRRSPRRPRAGAAGPSRRRPLADALHHERRICRLLRHRHGPAQRGQRHHRSRHHVPDPARGDGHGRRLGRRHHLRGHRSRPCHHRARLADALHQHTATATACCRTPTRPSRSSAIAGPMAASRSSRSTGGASCPAPAGCRPIRGANSRWAG